MTRRRFFGASRQQGYSLLEIGLVLCVMLMIAATAAWNFSDRFRVDQDQGMADYMESLHEAVLAYSAENRTPGMDVIYEMEGSSVSITVHVPSGRPILPCPDMDGDGFEDRYNAGGFAGLNTTYATVTVSIEENNDIWWVDLEDTPLRCLDNKGVLPWRTLKVQPADHWGQLFTYWVDLNLANGVYGFDQTTRASTIFKHFAVLVPEQARVFQYVIQNSTSSRAVDHSWQGRYHYVPGVVLERQPDSDGYEVRAGEVFGEDSVAHKSLVEQRRLNFVNGPEVNVIEYGSIDPGTATTGVVSVFVNPTGPTLSFVSNGIAFAMVSHGQNGLGGRVYDPARLYNEQFTCRTFPNFPDNEEHIEEKLNARHEYNCEYEIPSTPCSRGKRAGCQTDERPTGIFFVNQNTFLNKKVGGKEFEKFDDVVTWMDMGTLINRLSGDGMFPLPLPPVGFIHQP